MTSLNTATLSRLEAEVRSLSYGEFAMALALSEMPKSEPKVKAAIAEHSEETLLSWATEAAERIGVDRLKVLAEASRLTSLRGDDAAHRKIWGSQRRENLACDFSFKYQVLTGHIKIPHIG